MKETRIPPDTPDIVIEVESGTLKEADLIEFVEALEESELGRAVLFGVVPRGGGGIDWEEISKQAVTSITHVVNVWLPWAWEHGPDEATKALGIVKIIESFVAWAKKHHAKEKVPATSEVIILGPRGQVILSVEVAQKGHIRETTKEHLKDHENGRPPMNIIEE